MNFVNLIVCPDCQAYLCSDHSVFDYWYDSDESEKIISSISEKVEEMMEERQLSYILESSEMHDPFSSSPCECCQSRLAGYRYKIIGGLESEVTRLERMKEKVQKNLTEKEKNHVRFFSDF